MRATTLPKNAKTALFALVLLGFSAFSQADPIRAEWSETLEFDEVTIDSDTSSYTYVHDLTTDGFVPLVDLIVDFQLTVNLVDDAHDGFFGGAEAFIVNLPGFLGDRVYFDLSGDEYGGFSLAGWIELNVFGTLTVTIDRLWGDGVLESSTLVARGLTHSVPEPGTLALLGIGLIGIGLSRRRRKI